jgi:hypothetical protein
MIGSKAGLVVGVIATSSKLMRGLTCAASVLRPGIVWFGGIDRGLMVILVLIGYRYQLMSGIGFH